MPKKIYKRPKKKEEKSDFELEGIPFVGGLVKGIEKLVDLAERVEEAGGKIERKGEIKGLGRKEGIRGIYGFSIRTGLGKEAKPRLQTFGNIKETKKGPKIIKTREPIVDVFDEKNHILVVAELPGINQREVKANLKGDILILETGKEKRKYYKEILLPSKVNPKTKKIIYKNGILEIKFKKTKAQ